MVLGVLAVLSADAQSGSRSPQGGARDYIHAEFKGRFSAAVGAGGEHTGFQIQAQGVTWEVDASASTTLLQTARQLDGKLATATGTFGQRTGVSRVRRILIAKTLESGAETDRDEYINVTVRGTLNTGVMAIGAETTGVTITANGVTWELELEGNQRELASNLNGAKAIVAGQLRNVAGIEIRHRLIVKVQSVKPG